MASTEKSALEQLKEQLPADLVPGYSIASTGEVDPKSLWIDKMKRFSDDLALNAYAYYNFTARSNGPLKKTRRTPKKILSPDGFPPWVTVTYAYPPPQAFYSMDKEREVKFFVFHSFGHGWHATAVGGKKVGWMNTRGVTPITFENKTVYIPSGSDPDSLAHWSRFAAGLSACLSATAKTSAHFFIDRNGNLVVVGDCNDVLFTTKGLNKKGIGVELEEAFYVLEDTKGKGNKALWRPGGNPKGTAGNVKYFAYSIQQLLTLSIVVKKLELAYPTTLPQRNLYFTEKNVNGSSAPGYTMHNMVEGGSHIDVSPHFLTQDLWNAFFELVDSHQHITTRNIWKGYQKYEDTGQSIVVDPLAEGTVTSMTERLLQIAKEQGIADARSSSLANMTRKVANSTAGKEATRNSLKESQKVADTIMLSQQTQHPPVDYAADSQPVGDDGLQVGSDDVW